ncbi:MAG: ParB N-terminal domain-containing protein [Treponema sp.]|jgi:ParB family chromosome partitioning protein|nr:ParB N-terminal domain-containing protein [Treponema sp.]
MQVPIQDIIVRKRIRHDMGDIPGLAESMKRYGQINPIMISKKNILIAGGRRLEAAKYLGWKTINAVIADVNEKIARLEYEIEENIQRQEFNDEEIIQATQELNKLKNAGFFRKIFNIIASFFRKIFKIPE